MKYKLIRITPGKNAANCLFNSVAYGILQRINNSTKYYTKLGTDLRKVITNEMKFRIDQYEKNGKYENDIIVMSGEWEGISENDNSNIVQKAKKYVKWIQKNCNMGGHIELKLLNMYVQSEYDVQGIIVHDADQLPDLKKIKGYTFKIKSNKKYSPIKLILHGVKNGGIHFNYINNLRNVSIRG